MGSESVFCLTVFAWHLCRYMFAVFAGLQGLFILVFHCIRDPTLRSDIARRRNNNRR